MRGRVLGAERRKSEPGCMRQAKGNVVFPQHLEKLGDSIECLQKLSSHLARRSQLLTAAAFWWPPSGRNLPRLASART